MTEEIIDTVNKDVLRGFKTLQKNKNVLLTSASGEYLTTVSDKSMIVYANAKEIHFDGTFKLARNKLIPVEHDLVTTLKEAINTSNFEKLKDFNKNMIVFQKYCYENNLKVNIADIFDTISRLFNVYSSFTLFKSTTKNEVMLSFSNDKHKTYLLSKLI